MNNTTTDRQHQREQLTADILQQVRSAIQDELADAPESFSFEESEVVEQTVMSHTQLVVAALGISEMQNEGALLAHIANARADASRLIREGAVKKSARDASFGLNRERQ